MGKINSYATADNPISGSDKMIGTESTNDNATKNFTVAQLAEFINGDGNFVPYSGATEDLDLGVQFLYAAYVIPTEVLSLGSGALITLNGDEGTSGQVLTSQGSGTPIWTNPNQGSQGAQGPVGPQGLQGVPGPVGPAGLNWQGSWVSGTSYVVDDAVGHNGASWFCVLATSGTTPPNADVAHWALLASQGAEGPQGPIGPTGPQGPAGSSDISSTANNTFTGTNQFDNTVSFVVNTNFLGAIGLNGNYGGVGQVLTSQGTAADPIWTTVSGSAPYKSYVAIVTYNSSTSVFTQVVLQNDFSGVTFTWSDPSAGLFRITPSASVTFTNDKTVAFVNSYANQYFVTPLRAANPVIDYITLTHTKYDGTINSIVSGKFYIEIRVYP